ncbi:hypothetical protein Tco_1174334 [Tanacetum coccineum]
MGSRCSGVGGGDVQGFWQVNVAVLKRACDSFFRHAAKLCGIPQWMLERNSRIRGALERSGAEHSKRRRPKSTKLSIVAAAQNFKALAFETCYYKLIHYRSMLLKEPVPSW